MIRTLFVVTMLLFSLHCISEGTRTDQLIGIWQIVKFEPPASNTPMDADSFFIFLENGKMLDVNIFKDDISKVSTTASYYELVEGTLIITRNKGEVTKHKLNIEGNTLEMRVPFGKIILRKTPNKSSKMDAASGAIS